MSALLQQFAQFRIEVEANQRLRWGLFLIAAISGLYITLVLDDLQVALHADYESLEKQRGEIASLEPEAIWNERAILEAAALQEKEIVVWKAESEALARANMQSKISSFAEAAKFQKFKLNVGSFQPHEKLANISVVRFELDAAYTEDKMLDFINALESHIPLFKVVRLTLRQGTQRSRVTMVIFAYYQTE